MGNLQLAFKEFTKSAFRLELLDEYRSAGETDEYHAYLGGRPLPDLRGFQPWLDQISTTTSSGSTWSRVHVVPETLTSYLRFEIEWGYLYSARAGEQIRILRSSDYKRVDLRGLSPRDFWLFDDRVVFEMLYEADGSFKEGREVLDQKLVDRYRSLKEVVWAQAQPLEEFLAAYRRTNTKV